jgi:17beta-estradiol 17-dehydrogenase / very-long-chain 3-oxoacyl-CoA reductase
MIASCLQGLIAIAFLIGIFKLLKFLHTLFAPCFYFPVDLHKRYSGGWALITGASEGIGFAIAEELARKGFNLILASRSLQKLQKARSLIL